MLFLSDLPLLGLQSQDPWVFKKSRHMGGMTIHFYARNIHNQINIREIFQPCLVEFEGKATSGYIPVPVESNGEMIRYVEVDNTK